MASRRRQRGVTGRAAWLGLSLVACHLSLVLVPCPASQAAGAGEGSAPIARGHVPLAMWVWDVRHVTKAPARQQILAFCRAEGVSTLYVTAYQFTPGQAEAYRALKGPPAVF